MKKVIFFLLFFLSLESFAQISLDFQTTIYYLQTFKLSNSVTKWFDYAETQYPLANQLSLYNLDGTLFKTIQIPPDQNPNSEIVQTWYFSETLFDNDPSNIEFIVQYAWDSCTNCNDYYYHVKVIREDGTVLLDEMNATQWDIFNTEEGAKLRLIYQYANSHYYNTKVFGLPGELPTSIDEEFIDYGINPVLYPNPNNGSFFIDFQSNVEDFSTMDLYSTSGKHISTYKSNEKITFISNPGLSNGIYFITTKSKGINRSKKLIIEK